MVTDDGISVLDFARIEDEGTGIARLIALGPEADQQGLDVSVTPDGRYALARRPGSTIVQLVDLEDDAQQELDLAMVVPPDAPTDDGTRRRRGRAGSDGRRRERPRPRSVRRLRARGRAQRVAVLRIPVPGGFEDPASVEAKAIEDEVDRLGHDHAGLRSRPALHHRRRHRAHDDPGARRGPRSQTVALRKTIQAVAIAPDSETALIIHKKAEGDPAQPGITPDLQIDRSFGYSVLRVRSGDVKLQVTPTPPGLFTIVPDGSYLFVLFGSGRARGAEGRGQELPRVEQPARQPADLARHGTRQSSACS